MPLALLALTAGAFGIGVTEFVIMGLLLEISVDLGVSLQAAGLLVSGYAFGVVLGAPILTIVAAKLPKKTVLVALMIIFTLGNVACALAPDYTLVLIARVLTAFAHGTFFGVGSVVAAGRSPDATLRPPPFGEDARHVGEDADRDRQDHEEHASAPGVHDPAEHVRESRDPVRDRDESAGLCHSEPAVAHPKKRFSRSLAVRLDNH
jgi:hypothetical protein